MKRCAPNPNLNWRGARGLQFKLELELRQADVIPPQPRHHDDLAVLDQFRGFVYMFW